MADRFVWRDWVGGRSGRQEYWLWVAILFAAGVALSYVPGASGSNFGLSVVLIVVEVRRLHDADRTGWWSALANLAPMAIVLGLLAVASLDVAILVSVAVELVGIVVIGVLPPSAGENRFGARKSFSWRSMLLGR